MKRDMDLVRQILIETEKAEGPLQGEHFADKEHGISQVAYHIEMMEHHGLLEANLRIDKFYNVYKCEIVALTWDGCDYLDAIRDQSIWAKTKQVVKEAVGSTTLDVIKETAKLVAIGAIKAQLGMM